MKAVFSHEARADGVLLTLMRRRLLGAQRLPVGDWAMADGRVGLAARFLLGLTENGGGALIEDGLLLSHGTVASLPATVADAAELPQLGTLSLTIAFDGIMTDSRGHISARWYDAEDRNVAIRRQGSLVSAGNTAGRLSAPLFALVEAIDAYNATRGHRPESRIAAWAPVQAALRHVGGGEVRTDDRFLTSLTVYQAGAIALEVLETPSGPDFLPVLMGREKVAESADEANAPEDGDTSEASPPQRDLVADALLPPRLQKRFAREIFTGEPRSRDAYVLDQNTYLVIDPSLKTVLDVVRRKRAAPKAERIDFLKNPRAHIAASLGDETGDMALSLMVETWQYSERILGLGLWEPPAMPWLKSQAGQWLPERFPVQIGSETIELDKPLFETLKREVASACATGSEKVVADHHEFLLTDVQETFERLGFDRSGAAATPAGDDKRGAPSEEAPPQEPQETAARQTAAGDDHGRLIIHQNLDGRDFTIMYAPRPVAIATGFPDPPLVTTPPKPHQIVGFDWLVACYRRGWPGALLADDMGLGKTFQALAFLAWVRRNRSALGLGRGTQHKPILIVAPTALLRNWADEAEHHLGADALGPRIDAFGSALHKLKLPKDANWSPETALDVARLRVAGWVLTTYETLADNHRAFARVAFSVAVFDEAQKIKSPGAINTQSAKAMNADFVVGLTGTPIENRLADLWSIMDRIVPGYLGDLKSFIETYERGGEDELRQLKSQLDRPRDAGTPPLLLRRMKSEILEGLPARQIRRERVIMPAEQASAYHQTVVRAQTGGATQADMLRAIHGFRGISLHPAGASGCDPLDPRSVDAWIAGSARLVYAVQILERVRSRGEKALVFIEDLAVQALFATAIATRFGLGRQPSIINGEVAGEKRLEIVTRFQSAPAGFDLLVLSPKAAGIGLTITAANHVLHLSRWWNPAVEDQCNDRCYRIGQSKPVTVHIPIAVHPDYGDASFDVRLDALLENKRKLSRDMLVPPIAAGDVQSLFEQTVSADRAATP